MRELLNSHQLRELLFSSTARIIQFSSTLRITILSNISPCSSRISRFYTSLLDFFLKQISGEKNISHNMYLGVSITTYQHTRAGANKCSLPGLRIFKALRVYCIHHKISSCISLYWNLALSLHSCEQDIIIIKKCHEIFMLLSKDE